ncbi:MAG: dipeptidyl aminopeptidase/acylaminoacyl peptidase, partial [Myxococcota bacterium]
MLALLTAAALATTWQQPPQAILDVLHAPLTPSARMSPDGEHALLVRPIQYPALADKAAAMLPLAGVRVDARTNGHHGWSGYEDPILLTVADGAQLPLEPGGPIVGIEWSADGERLALALKQGDRIALWVGTADGTGAVVPDVALNPLLGVEMAWMPDQDRLLVLTVPSGRGPMPSAPPIPAGPETRDAAGATASSTYEARDLLTTAHDDALFTHFATSQIGVVSADDLSFAPIGEPGVIAGAASSPNGKLLLVERLNGPWSHRVAWWRFGSTVEVWKPNGKVVHTVATHAAHESVPIHGVPVGVRSVSWRSSAPATLVWVEAQDGGDWSTEVTHRDYILQHAAPFRGAPEVVFHSQHRVNGWWWGEASGAMVVEQYERSRRWRHVWQADVDRKTSKRWFDLSYNDRYADPGRPMTRPLASGHRVLREHDGALFFSGSGSSPDGDRPFVDRRPLGSDTAERLFRSDPERYERFVAWQDMDAGTFLMLGESPTDPPNLHQVTLGDPAAGAAEGEAQWARSSTPVTAFADPTPVLRGIQRRIVTYEREDGVPLSFVLYLPPGYEEGTALPTVVYAYPREFSDASTAGQVRGSEKTFTRFGGPSHLFFLLQGYAVLHNTRMPVIGDPDTAYDTFVEQLVSGAKAAVDEAV